METYLSCASSVSQIAAQAALTGPQDCIAEMLAAYADRKDICVAELDKAGIRYARPQGAFYIMMGIGESGLGSYDFSLRLLDDTGVAVAPGLTFGPGSDHYVRLSFCADRDDISEGMAKLCGYYADRFIKTLSPAWSKKAPKGHNSSFSERAGRAACPQSIGV